MNPNGSLKWTRSVSGVIYSSPTIDPYGTLVLGNYGGDLIAVNAANGSTLWERALGQNLYSSPTVGGGGSVFIIDSFGRLSKFSGLLLYPPPDVPEPSSLLVLAWSLGAGAAMTRFAGRRRTRASR
jgi:outer membrane protein assembly factor BamB